ncbi:hypothetical protein MHYP_G00348550 [Metynnis hypsauchen]
MSQHQGSGGHPAMLMCSAYDFYPPAIDVYWLRDGEKVTGDVTSTEEMADGDWYYQIHSHLEYTPSSGEKISCVVEHASSKKPIINEWDGSLPESERNKVAIGASGLVLAIILTATGFIYYKKKSSETTDSERTFLHTAITEVLPELSEVTKYILEETLQSIGVETYNDFQFIEEADLLSALRPIQARKVLAAWKLRCQTPETSSSSVSVSPGPPAFLLSVSPRSSSSAPSSSCQSPEIDWVDSFMTLWDKFPEELIQLLERGKRPSPQMRREMVRIVVHEMMRKNSCISKRTSTEVAKKMVAKYSKSLQDIIEGEVVGPGYHSLVKQLQYRVENVKRSATPKIRKRKHRTDESDADEVPPEKRAAIQDTYGCVNWDLKFLPLGKTPESQQEKKEKLKMRSQQTSADSQEIRLLMRATFSTHRKQRKFL